MNNFNIDVQLKWTKCVVCL